MKSNQKVRKINKPTDKSSNNLLQHQGRKKKPKKKKWKMSTSHSQNSFDDFIEFFNKHNKLPT